MAFLAPCCFLKSTRVRRLPNRPPSLPPSLRNPISFLHFHRASDPFSSRSTTVAAEPSLDGHRNGFHLRRTSGERRRESVVATSRRVGECDLATGQEGRGRRSRCGLRSHRDSSLLRRLHPRPRPRLPLLRLPGYHSRHREGHGLPPPANSGKPN